MAGTPFDTDLIVGQRSAEAIDKILARTIQDDVVTIEVDGKERNVAFMIGVEVEPRIQFKRGNHTETRLDRHVGIFKEQMPDFIDEVYGQGTDESERLKNQVSSYGPVEFLMHRLSKEFSRPMSEPFHVAPDIAYGEIRRLSHESGWIAWRFGSDRHGTGWFDMGDTPEYRINPCAPSECLDRIEEIDAFWGELETLYGIRVRQPSYSRHFNLSVFDVETGENLLLDDRLMADAISGIHGLFADGFASLHPALRRRKEPSTVFAPNHVSVASHRRHGIRIKHLIEVRGWFGSTAHALSWLTNGAALGLKRGVEGLSEHGYKTPVRVAAHKVKRSENYDAAKSHYLRRVLEWAEVDFGVGSASINKQFWTAQARWLTANFAQECADNGLNPEFDFLAVVLHGLRVDADGVPSLALNDIGLPEEWQGRGLIEAMNSRLAEFRLEPATCIYSEAESPEFKLDEYLCQLRSSPLLNDALGEKMERLIPHVRRHFYWDNIRAFQFQNYWRRRENPEDYTTSVHPSVHY